jgi:hypothetical protein
MPPRKHPFTPEPDTQPERRASGRAPKSKRSDASLPPTLPPPKGKRGKGSPASAGDRNSGTRSRRPAPKGDTGAATIDEVTADLSRDPRREKD